MEKRRKNLAYYWDFMDIPLVIYLVYILVNFFFPFTSFMSNTLASLLSLTFMVFVFGFVGYNVSKAGDDSHAKAGAWAGVFAGLVASVFSIASYYMFPQRFAEAIQKAVAAGASASTVNLFTQISLFAGLVISPLIYAGLGALIAWVSKFIFKKKHAEKREEKKPAAKKSSGKKK